MTGQPAAPQARISEHGARIAMVAEMGSALVDERRRAWIVSARALGEHRRVCLSCQQQQDCAEYAALDGQERDAWNALERARRAA